MKTSEFTKNQTLLIWKACVKLRKDCVPGEKAWTELGIITSKIECNIFKG